MAVELVGRQISKPHAVAYGAAQDVDGYRLLGPELNRVGNTRLAAAVRVAAPRLRQIQVAIHDGMKIARRIAHLHADNAIVFLARRAAVLPLYAGRLVALFYETGLINQADRVLVAVLLLHPVLQPRTERVLGPAVDADEFLQRSRRHARIQRDCLHLLAFQIADLPIDVRAQVPTGRPCLNAVSIIL